MYKHQDSLSLTIEDAQRHLIDELIAGDDKHTAGRLIACRHGPRPSHCTSKHCPRCIRYHQHQYRQEAHQQIIRTIDASPQSVILVVELTSTDCPPDQIRSRFKTLLNGWGKLYQSDGRKKPLLARMCLTAFGHVECTPSARDPSQYNPHLHGVFVMRPSYPGTGRNHIRTSDSSDWLTWWDEVVNGVARSAHVTPPDNLDAVLTYGFKSGRRLVNENGKALQPDYYSEQTQALRPGEQILFVQNALAGLSRNVAYSALPN